METTVTPQGTARVVRFLANTKTKDRHGTIVLPQGVKLEQFWKNPLFCWSHPQARPTPPDPEDVIGRILAIEVTEEGLYIDAEFAPAEVNDKADRCCRAVQAGFLRAVSIGFHTLREHVEGNGSEQVTLITDWELLEVSLVILGSNPDAVALRSFINPSHPIKGHSMSTKEAFQKLSLPEDASHEEAQKAYKSYAESTEDDEETQRAVKRALEQREEERDGEEPEKGSDDERDEEEERTLLTQMSREVKTLRQEVGTLRSELTKTQNLQTVEKEVSQWIREGRYPAHKRDKLLELHQKGKAKDLVESIEPGTFAAPGKRIFAGGDPFQETMTRPKACLNEFDRSVIAVFEKQGLLIDAERYLREKQEVEARLYLYR